MVFDIGVIVAIISMIGGLIAWIWSQIKDRTTSKVELERRLQAVEQAIAVNSVKDEQTIKSLGEILDAVKEIRGELKTASEAAHLNAIDIAVLKSKEQL